MTRSFLQNALSTAVVVKFTRQLKQFVFNLFGGAGIPVSLSNLIPLAAYFVAVLAQRNPN